MNLKSGREEAGNAGEGCRDDAADQQREEHAGQNGNTRKIIDVPEERAGIDALVHDHGCEHHAGAHHTPHREVCTGQEDQAADTQCQEHARGCRLQDVQDIVHRQQLGMLDHRSQDAKQDKDADDHDIQTVGQEKLFHVKGIFVVFPVLLPFLPAGEMREPEQVDQVIAIGKGVMSPILDLLKGSVVLELRIKLTVFIDVFFVLDFARILQLRKLRFMFALQFGELRFITFVLFRLFRRTGSDDLVVVFLVVVCVQITDRLVDQ